MRKQYHFRPSGRGYDAWDVDRLVELSKDLAPQPANIDSLREIDENFWFAGKNDRPTCLAIVAHMRLIEAADMIFRLSCRRMAA